jgi:hypothetical protein
MNDNKELEQELARLESTHDHLSTELHNLNDILKKIGFQDGLETLKQAAKDLETLEGEDELP